MKRTTIFMPETLERDLQLYARREGKPAASVVREAVTRFIARRSTSVLPMFAGAFDSGRSDTAERHDEILFGTLGPHGQKPAHRPRRVRSAKGPAKAGHHLPRAAKAGPHGQRAARAASRQRQRSRPSSRRRG